jgi:hypothetical protein
MCEFTQNHLLGVLINGFQSFSNYFQAYTPRPKIGCFSRKTVLLAFISLIVSQLFHSLFSTISHFYNEVIKPCCPSIFLYI